MVLIALIHRSKWYEIDRPHDQSALHRRQRLWRWFLHWLGEPIPFPGMTFNFEPRQTGYNQDESTLSKSARK